MSEAAWFCARRALPLAAALMLSGCAGLEAPTRSGVAGLVGEVPEVALPSAARVVPGIEIDRWWTQFGDLALNQRIEQALARNSDLAVAAARLREAHARFDEVRGAQRPWVELQATSGRARVSADSIDMPGVGTRIGSSHEVALTGRYEVDLWGRLASGTDAARWRLTSQAWARASVEWSLSAQTAEAHFTLRSLQRQIDIAHAVRDSRVRSMTLRRREHGAGAVNEFELRRAEAEAAVAETALTALQRQHLATAGVLSLLTGEPAAALGDRPAPVATLDPAQPFEPLLPQGSVADWLQLRPDLRQAEAQLAAAHADIAAARAATMPTLQLSGSVGSDVRELSNLFSGPGFAWSVAAGLAQSVFDGGRKRARVEQAEARSDAALAQYRRSVAGALVEIREAYVALDLTQRALAAERQRVAALDRAQRLARLGLDAGALSRLDALDAERNHFQAQLAEVDAYRQRLIGQVAVFKALGGGHRGHAGQTVIQATDFQTRKPGD
jgi:multidrug efflux system outer membrane protein